MKDQEPPNCNRLHALEKNRLEVLKKLSARPTKGEVNAAKHVLDKVGHVVLRQPGVTAVDVGFRVISGEDRFNGEVAVRAHVESKRDERFLKKDGRTPISELNLEALVGRNVKVTPPLEKRRPEPGSEEGFQRETVYFEVPADPDDPDAESHRVPIDIIEARYLPSNGTIQVSEPKLSDRNFDDPEVLEFASEPVHPLVGGVSIGAGTGPAGTLGAVVWDHLDGAPCLLSNWHVLAGSVSSAVGQPCYQPAIFDGGDAGTDTVGALKRWHFGRHGDAAIAAITCDRPYAAGEILGLHVPVAGMVEPRLGMPVRKWGRTTGFSKGFIDGIYLTINVDYDGVGVQRFDNQIHIAVCESGTEVSAQGDSGALWVTKYVPIDPDGDGPKVEETPSPRPKSGGAKARQQAPVPPGKSQGTGNQSGDKYDERKVYYAVALHFAGDAPGARSGEFAVASPIRALAERLHFSFRPVFFPRSRFVIRPASAKPTQPGQTPGGGSPVQPGGAQGGVAGPQPIPSTLGDGG